MLKKSFIIVGIIIIFALAAAGFYAYKKGIFATPFKNLFLNFPLFKGGRGGILTAAELLSSFKISNPNLTPEQAQLFQQRFDEIKKTLQSSPDDFNSWLYLGILKKGAGDYIGSRDVFIYVGQIRPQNSTSFANLADLYAYFLNEPIKAETSIKQAIANDPNDFNLYLALADIYRYKFPGKEALYEPTILEAIAKLPNNPNLIAPLAGYYRDTNQTQSAIDWYEKLLKLAPDNAAAKADLAELENKIK